MLVRPLALVAFFVLGFLGCPSCGASCDTEDGTLECYCEENPENCRDTPDGLVLDLPERDGASQAVPAER